MTVRVVVAEPDTSQQVSLAGALAAHADIDVVAVSDDIASTLLQAERVAAHVVVVAPGFAAPLAEVCARLQDLPTAPRMLILDPCGDEDALLGAIEAGVDGYATSAAEDEVTADAIRAVSRGESVIPPAMLGPLLRRLIERRREADRAAEQLVQLTRREREILALLVAGLDHHAIGRELFISPETARTHLQRVLRKLGVHSRSEAVALVERTGLADRLERLVERSAS